MTTNFEALGLLLRLAAEAKADGISLRARVQKMRRYQIRFGEDTSTVDAILAAEKAAR